MKQLVFLFLFATASLASSAEPLDYSGSDLWLCHPDNLRFCLQNQSTTIIDDDGKFTIEHHEISKNPTFDCFYVYPTVSDDASANSDVNPGHHEARAIQAQFARFGEICRPYAPIYRQATSTALRSLLSGAKVTIDRELLVSDVTNAWNYYLEHKNEGRGVILIGHSQGSGVLTELILNEIDGREVQQKIIAAYLLGASGILNPPGKDVGGTFKHMRLCRKATQNQCIVAYNSFRDKTPPPKNTRYGRARNPKNQHLNPACNLPGALAGGTAPLDAYLSTSGENLGSSSNQPPWTNPWRILTTPFVRVPGLLVGECVLKNGFSYLEVRVLEKSESPRANDIGGDVVINQAIAAEWGLHLIDVHLAMGNLVALAKQQGAAYVARERLDN